MHYTIDQIRLALKKCHRLSLADLPTPLEDVPKLSEALGGPRILVKREDQTGLAFGGNKVREFEYSVAPAVSEGYDVLLHGAASQSNQSRLTAAVAAKLGLKMVMVGRKDEHSNDMNGNLFLTHLFGADVHLVESAEERSEVEKKLEADGHKVYNTSYDGYYLRSVAYVDGFIELWEQLQEQNVVPDALYVCSGVHTHVGLVVGAKALGVDLRIVGISPSPQDNAKKNMQLAEVANEVCKILSLDIHFTADDFESYGEYAGEDYGVLTRESRESVLLAARTEGLLLDPVYSGKTFAAMIEHIRKGKYTKDQTVLFVHTGGTPALFAYADELLNKTE
ncbi:MAG: D-cysteine desulfhydrase family protein [Candidatus Latescibacteria bacterium]|jgi:L-cysteate sulfo-lyase|nr:D-cysteine desulfhydrase family protein [Candidatus Latescibacterota bacterium]MBT5828972.1 D-cysteine desulfhydrase family protein [Candidatus Latescibacterota bacterium]